MRLRKVVRFRFLSARILNKLRRTVLLLILDDLIRLVTYA